MFDTLILQQRNKLVKCQIGDLPSPEAFHTVYVQCFKSECIKASTKVSGEFPVPVKALPADLAIQYTKFSDRTPPVSRTFFLASKVLIEHAELFQGLLQELRRLYLLTRAKCQICVLHTEVCPNALTCSGYRFGRSIVCYDIEPVFTNSVSQDLDIADVPVPVSVLMERKTPFAKLQTLRVYVPFFEGEDDTAFAKFVTRLKLRRPITSLAFELRETYAGFIESPLIGEMDTDNNPVKGIARYPCPMSLGALEQLRQMRLKTITTRILAIATVISLFQTQEMIMDIAQVIKHITQAFVLRVVAYLVCIRSHCVLPCIVPLTPTQWVGRHVTLRLRCVCLPTRYAYCTTPRGVCQVYFRFFSDQCLALIYEGGFSSQT